MTLTKAGYFFAGWYRERNLIDPGNPDAGYTYSGKWNFDSDTLKLEAGKEYTADESALTLYAAWVPYYKYEIYAKDDNGNMQLISDVSAINLTIPEWADGDVSLNMDNFPVREGYTLVDVYEDEAMTKKVEATLNESGTRKYITGSWNEETATLNTPVIKLYTTWQEGERYRIYSTDDLIKNASNDGYYEIYADLNFEGLEWPTAFTNDKFSGKIFGNGHKISGISFESSSRSRISNGLFSALDDNAYIENLTFENVTHTINLVSVAPGATFGLLAGTVAEGVEFSNVTITGKLLLGDSCEGLAGSTDYSIGLIAGSGNVTGISSEISVEKANPGNNTFDVEITDGVVSIVKGSN
ncbi:MAG: hypothetical protein IJX58_07735 [Clostridia bacterium]|nr:hypothetical protein [Clostridia bacterium]